MIDKKSKLVILLLITFKSFTGILANTIANI